MAVRRKPDRKEAPVMAETAGKEKPARQERQERQDKGAEGCTFFLISGKECYRSRPLGKELWTVTRGLDGKQKKTDRIRGRKLPH
jgi:hypothetical protein